MTSGYPRPCRRARVEHFDFWSSTGDRVAEAERITADDVEHPILVIDTGPMATGNSQGRTLRVLLSR